MRAHIKRLMDDPAKREAMGKAAQKRIEEKFDWRVVGRQYEKFFEETEESIETKG